MVFLPAFLRHLHPARFGLCITCSQSVDRCAPPPTSRCRGIADAHRVHRPVRRFPTMRTLADNRHPARTTTTPQHAQRLLLLLQYLRIHPSEEAPVEGLLHTPGPDPHRPPVSPVD